MVYYTARKCFLLVCDVWRVFSWHLINIEYLKPVYYRQRNINENSAIWLLRIVAEQKKLGYKAHISAASYKLLWETSSGLQMMSCELISSLQLATVHLMMKWMQLNKINYKITQEKRGVDSLEAEDSNTGRINKKHLNIIIILITMPVLMT